MLELNKSKIGTIVTGDTLIAIDPTMGKENGIVFEAKPGTWNVYRLADDENTHEILIAHDSLKKFSEDKVEWSAEYLEVTTGNYCGFFDLNYLQTEKVETYRDMKVSTEMIGYCTKKEGCLTTAGYGAGAYTVLLAMNEGSETIAAKIVFIDEQVESEFESYEEGDVFEEFGIHQFSEFGDNDDEEDEEY